MALRGNQPARVDSLADRDSVAWYWRLIALLASWMILGGYLMLPAAFDSDPQLRFSKGVLSILVVTIMTTGYSFTALLCFACRSWMFQAEVVFLPALGSSIVGLLTVAWKFASSKRYVFNTVAKIHTALSAASTVIYAVLLFWTWYKLSRSRRTTVDYSKLNDSHDTIYYTNYIANQYPTSQTPRQPEPASFDEDQVAKNMARLLTQTGPAPSPDAFASTFHITLPEDPAQEMSAQLPPEAASYARTRATQAQSRAERNAWERLGSLGGRRRHGHSLSVDLANRGRNSPRTDRGQRPLSREERRIEIEMGALSSPRAPASR